MKIVFIGAVEIGYTVLKSVYDTNGSVEAIFTLPFDMQEKTSGFIDFEPLAKKNSSALFRVKDINSKEHIDKIKDINPDLIIVCGWQRLVCEEILNIPKLGTIGFHSSLLPKYRGRAPVNWAIIMGEKETGITMFYLTPEADDGDIIAQKSFPILLNDDCKTVYEKSALAGAELIKEFLPKIKNGTAARIHNPSGTYPAYPRRTPKDGLIDFSRSALDIYNFVRALTKPYPGAYYFDNNENKIIVWKIEIVFDESRLKEEDLVLKTLDFKIRLIEYE
ncbi:MAG: methionyl-tRNA formyltransferase [Sulfurimonas sp.]|nr:methionyl-tRNA formyltransferase [Sulfurimonas sp.]